MKPKLWRPYGKRRRPQVGDRVRVCQRRRYWFFGRVVSINGSDVHVLLDGEADPKAFDETVLTTPGDLP